MSSHGSYSDDAEYQTTMVKPVRVLWTRHCFSCSNAADPHNSTRDYVQKYVRPPLCHDNGVQQCIQLAYGLKQLAEAQSVDLRDVRFFCSILPRAMETAALTAAVFSEIHKLRTAEVQVLCNIGEFANEYEREELRKGPCVARASESINTELGLECWLRDFNKLLSQHQMHSTLIGPRASCAPPRSTCANSHEQVPLGNTPGAYAQFLREGMATWNDKHLYVVVSHGTFISQSLWDLKNLDEAMRMLCPPPPERMPNTQTVLQLYTRNEGGEFHAEGCPQLKYLHPERPPARAILDKYSNFVPNPCDDTHLLSQCASL